MTARELIEILSTYNPNTQVVYEHPQGELYIDTVYTHGDEIVLGTI